MKKKLIEVALPLEAINAAAAREKSIRHGHPSTLHLWWARRPLAAARAVIFAQMVDDPSSYPDLFPTEQAQQKERERLFRLIEELVQWENTTNEAVLERARAEIWQSWRRACAEKRQEIENRRQDIGEAECARLLAIYDPDKLPAFHDPFAGGGALPLEAQRLGLEAYASDLNPVAVLINKAMIEIPPRFAGLPPVNPESRKQWIGNSDALSRADGLAKGDGGGQGGVSAGSTVATGGNLRDAIADHAGGSIGAGEHRGGLGAGVGQGEGPVSGNRPGIACRDGNVSDALRGDRLVSESRNGKPAGITQRGGKNADDTKAEVQKLGNSGLGNSGLGNSGLGNSGLGNSKIVAPSISYSLFPKSYRGAEGLAADVRYYGKWMRDEAERRIGHLYPKVTAWFDPRSGRYFGEADVEAWRRSEERGVRNESGEQTARECGHTSLSSLLSTLSSRQLTVIAWLWARTVKSPNPAFADVDVPLASTFMLSTKAGKEAYVEPVIENRNQELGNSSDGSPISYPLSSTSSPAYRFTVKVGKPKDAQAAKNGTKLARGANFRCVMSGAVINDPYIKAESMAGRMGARLMAIVAEGERGRVYLAPTPEHEAIARQAKPKWRPDEPMNRDTANLVSGRGYGFFTWADLFTPRQLVALTTFSDLVGEAIERVKADAEIAFRKQELGNSGAVANSYPLDTTSLSQGGTGATAYAEAVGVYLALGVGRSANYWSSLTPWGGDFIVQTFGRQAIPMVWDHAEGNPLSASTGNWTAALDWIEKVMVTAFPASQDGRASHGDAQTQTISRDKVISTDPPYYDNIGYADLSDFFYVWLRRSLRPVFPDLFATLAVPKAEELVATPYRHGSKEKAEAFFLDGMTRAMQRLAEQAHPAFPVTIYYAFKQQEQKKLEEEGTINSAGLSSPSTLSSISSFLTSTSTGWETFLDAVIRSGFAITGTWPMRTEGAGRIIAKDTNALASSIVLVCRPRPANAPTATRREFVSALKAELPQALQHLQAGNIAPVDLAQAAIGPGMAVYTRYAQVLDAEGRPLSVREALALINQTLDECLAEQEGDFDADSRWALAWFEQVGFAEGEYGVAETLSKAKNTSVAGLVEAGIVESKRGKVRLLRPEELPDWEERVKRSEKREAGSLTPHSSPLASPWPLAHQLIRALESGGEAAAADLVAKLGSQAEVARELAYRLYTLAERKKRAAEALAYNALVQSWPEITRLAQEVATGSSRAADGDNGDLFA